MDRKELAAAVKESVRAFAQKVPGRSVELRVPPFVAVQCVEGPRHTRGTPPNIVETDATTWLALAEGSLNWAEAIADGRISASGPRSDSINTSAGCGLTCWGAPETRSRTAAVTTAEPPQMSLCPLWNLFQNGSGRTSTRLAAARKWGRNTSASTSRP